jgi:hypothetical protein
MIYFFIAVLAVALGVFGTYLNRRWWRRLLAEIEKSELARVIPAHEGGTPYRDAGTQTAVREPEQMFDMSPLLDDEALAALIDSVARDRAFNVATERRISMEIPFDIDFTMQVLQLRIDARVLPPRDDSEDI